MGKRCICVTCGTQYPESEKKPSRCMICEDERQYVGWDGQQWTTLDEMRSGGFRNEIRQEEAGVFSIVTKPEFAIGQRAFLVQTREGNALWDCLSYIDNETVNEVKSLGGLKFIAISHPHYYSCMNEWSESFGEVPIYLHELDRKWVMRHSDKIVYWSGKSLAAPLPGMTLVNLGGHFDGGTVLHWSNGASGKGAVFSGDIIQVVPDRRWASFMYSYPNLIPLSKRKTLRIAQRIGRFKFETVYGAFEGREIKKDAYAAVKRSAERYIKHIRE